jgi:hypothetical protein
MSPKKIGRQLERFLDGGPDEPQARWDELARLYKRGIEALEQFKRAKLNPRDRAGFESAVAALRRTYRDLHTAHLPVECMNGWQRIYFDAQITESEFAERRLAAVAKLRDSLKINIHRVRGARDGRR